MFAAMVPFSLCCQYSRTYPGKKVLKIHLDINCNVHVSQSSVLSLLHLFYHHCFPYFDAVSGGRNKKTN